MNDSQTNILSKSLFILVLIGCMAQKGQCQLSDKPMKANQMELCYPIQHFFDGTDTRLWVFSGYGKIRYWHEPFVIVFGHSGISYTRFHKEKGWGINGSIRLFGNSYFGPVEQQPFNKIPGDVLERTFGIVSINYLYPLLVDNRLHIFPFTGLAFRYGNETYFVNYFNRMGEYAVDSRNLADLGPSIGLKLSKPLPWNFHIGTEAKYTRFLYRRDKGNPYYPFDKGASPNLLTVQLNVGYRF